ncbi:arylsulfotransferase family protein [Methylophilaceae bacterium]|nr:arylsulfotransferase family protein [Methylophilaceae bacterium]
MALLSLLLAIGNGILVRQELVGSSKLGIISKTALFLAETPMYMKRMGLFDGSTNYDLIAKENRFPNVSGFQGSPLEEEFYLLLARYNGDAERSVVELIDLRSFETKKIWRPDIDQINDLVDLSLPQFRALKRDKNVKRYRIIHPFLTEDGGLIFHHQSPLVKIDSQSQLVWQNQEANFHHSLEQDHEGNFWVPTYAFPYQVDKKYVGSKYGNFDDDAITKVSPEGEILLQKSVTNILLENNEGHILFDNRFHNDPIHLNDIQPILNDGPYWKRGDIFLSLRTPSMIILYRPSTNKIIWKGRGHFFAQHDVDILDNHRISIFNNNVRAYFDGDEVDGHNKVVVYDFNTDSYSNYFDESLKQHDARTLSAGRSQFIKNNGSLFIEETDHSRLLYFDKNGSLQWEYVNRAEDNYNYLLNWSRILYNQKDINKVHKILEIEAKQ